MLEACNGEPSLHDFFRYRKERCNPEKIVIQMPFLDVRK
jgi:hypothetical protein